MRNVLITPRALDELGYWAREDRRILSRIIELVVDILRVIRFPVSENESRFEVTLMDSGRDESRRSIG